LIASLVIGLSAQAAINILPMGDSVTEAERPYNSYRRALWQFLEEAGVPVDFIGNSRGVRNPAHNDLPPDADFDLDHESYWGWDTREMLTSKGGLMARLDKLPEVADIVLLLLGVNDFSRLPCPTVTQTQQGLAEIIDVLRGHNAEITVLLGTWLPMNDKSLCDQDANVIINAFNARLPAFVASQSTNRSPVILVDLSVDFDLDNLDDDLYDGIHPDGSGEEKIAFRWYEALLPILEDWVFSSSLD